MAEQVLDAADLRRAQLERVLALARLSLGTLAVYVLVIDPAIAVNARSGMAARLLGAFMVYGLTAAVVVAFRGNSTALGTVLHMCDLGWAAAITSCGWSGSRSISRRSGTAMTVRSMTAGVNGSLPMRS